MPHRLDVECDIERQEVGERLNGQTIGHQRGPLRLHEEQLRGRRLCEESGQRSERGCLAAPAAEESWTGKLEGAKQGPERATMIAFGLEGGTAVRAGRAPVEKRIHLVVQQAFLDRGEELFSLLERQPQMLDALGVLLQGNEVCHGFFTAIIAAHDQLQFNAHGECSSGSGGGGMMQVILPEFVTYPQLLHALLHCQSEQIVKRGKTAQGTQRYLCQNTRCAVRSFLLNYRNRGCLPEIKQQIIDMSLNA